MEDLLAEAGLTSPNEKVRRWVLQVRTSFRPEPASAAASFKRSIYLDEMGVVIGGKRLWLR